MTSLEGEIWVPVFDANSKDNYEVSNMGRVRNIATQCVLKHRLANKYYSNVLILYID